MYLTLCSTRHVQSYIFRGSRLLENIGASYLVSQALSSWLRESLPLSCNLTETCAIDQSKCINDGLDAEVLYSGGGNSLILFRDEKASHEFASKLSRKILENAPGLELLITGIDFSMDESLLNAISELHRKVAQAKRFSTASTPLPTISVTARGTSGPHPACKSTTYHDRERLLDAESLAKLLAAQSQSNKAAPAERWLTNRIPIDEKAFAYPRDLDHLGSAKGEFSYIAVIHADADDLGNRIVRLGNKHPKPSENGELISTLRSFSSALDEAATGALCEAVGQLIEFLQPNEDSSALPKKSALELVIDSGRTLLPVRPLIIGGDDITIVCDARIAHSFAKTFISAFERLTASLPDGEGSASMSAGIAIVKSHFPFSRAYELANQLTKSAKFARKRARESTRRLSHMDWAVIQSGAIRSLETMRDHEYSTPQGSLCLRPVSLSNLGDDYKSWKYIESCIRIFQSDEWSSKRNKVKELRESLREGKDAVKEFRSKFLSKSYLPKVEGAPQDFCESGWYGNSCGYFDALELMDFFVSIR